MLTTTDGDIALINSV